MGHSVTQALHDWQRGDDRASYELDRRLRADLLALVRRRRNQRYQARIDSEAVVNAALKSFLSGAVNGEFPDLHDRYDVKRLLAHFVLCVLRDQVRGLQAAKRDARREIREPELVSRHAADLKQPTPDECAMAVEYWEKFPEVVRGVHEKSIEILERSLEGLSAAEIAQDLGLGVRTVQLIIQRMIEAWQRWLLKGP